MIIPKAARTLSADFNQDDRDCEKEMSTKWKSSSIPPKLEHDCYSLNHWHSVIRNVHVFREPINDPSQRRCIKEPERGSEDPFKHLQMQKRARF